MTFLFIWQKLSELQVKHLQEDYCDLRKAGLTLCRHKCCIGKHEVKYLALVFPVKEMLANKNNTKVVKNWAIPNDVMELCRFLGNASYYRRYVHHSANIARPVYQVTHKEVHFTWSAECQ